MLETLAEIGSRREVWMFYGATNGEFIVQHEHLLELAAAHPNFHLHFCFSRPGKEDLLDDTHFKTRVNVDFLKETLSSNNYEFYICGPGEMMQDITEGLESWGVPEQHIHFEGFGPASVKRTAESHAPVEKSDVQYTVRFSKSDKSCIWKPDSGSLLNLARANDVTIDSGCEAGNCGTCIVAIREGEIDYLSEPGSMPEKGSCLACIAVPKGELVIDA
jgi:ferredoxin-NADP reductase